jgi:hypothetical protein
MSKTDKTQLSGGPDKTVTWIWLDSDGGRLKVEYYDFSETAQRLFGNDVAYTITVHEMDQIYVTIHQDETTSISGAILKSSNGWRKMVLILQLQWKVGHK